MLFFRKTYVLGICKNRLAEAILTNTQNIWFIKTFQKYPLFMHKTGPYQVSLKQQIRLNGKIFGNKHCRNNEGPVYFKGLSWAYVTVYFKI